MPTIVTATGSPAVNTVWNHVTNATAIGRFGWKAEQPTVLQQTAAAFIGDIGITSPLFRDENHTPRQHLPPIASAGGEPEVSDRIFQAVALYARSLAVPAARTAEDPPAVRGRQLFAAARCDACHAAELKTGPYPDLPELANQTIHAFTDLLLHDMGEGLADDRPAFTATGREWRTAPLWGLGLVAKVNGHTFLLHDGRGPKRAKDPLARRRSGGSRQAFRLDVKTDRAALIAFWSRSE
jgi:CxxC motif-containing protein (DUF1111 family)